MYIFVICNCFIITGPLLESTWIKGPDETMAYQQQQEDNQPPLPPSSWSALYSATRTNTDDVVALPA